MDDLCVNKSQIVPVIFEPPCTHIQVSTLCIYAGRLPCQILLATRNLMGVNCIRIKTKRALLLESNIAKQIREFCINFAALFPHLGICSV
jgi:hypothetical protein